MEIWFSLASDGALAFTRRDQLPSSVRRGRAAVQPAGKCGLVNAKRRCASSGARFTQPWLRTWPKPRCQNAPWRPTPFEKYWT